MLKGNFNFLRMVKRTIDHLNKNKIYWQSNVILVAIIKLIVELNTKTEKLSAQQQTIITGYAQKRRTQKKVVVVLTDIIIGAIRTYASINGDDVLQNKVKYSRSDLWRLRDLKFDGLAKSVITISSSLIEDLKEYGITKDIIDTYSKEISNYNRIRTEPGEVIKVRKAATASIKPLISELRDTLNVRLDSMMKQFELTHPQFYMEYTKQREIVDTPTHKLSIKGNVTNKNSEEPLLDVIVTLLELKKETETTELGYYQFKNIKRGEYKIQFKRESFKPITQTIAILDNQTSELNIEMERN